MRMPSKRWFLLPLAPSALAGLLFLGMVVFRPPHLDQPTGDDHHFRVTVNWQGWKEFGIYLVLWCGEPFQVDTFGTVTLFDGPRTADVYVPHKSGCRDVSITAVWFSNGIPETRQIGLLAYATGNPFTTAGPGPTDIVIDLDKQGVTADKIRMIQR